jgi:hypothetical protein
MEVSPDKSTLSIEVHPRKVYDSEFALLMVVILDKSMSPSRAAHPQNVIYIPLFPMVVKLDKSTLVSAVS